MTCRTCKDTGWGRAYDPDETWPCDCELGNPHRTKGELAFKYLLDALPTMRKET